MSLRVGDLEHLIKPLVSIDEYDSKLGKNEEVIVVTFFAKDEDPGKDLNSFIQKGNPSILDVELSPAPSEDGSYLIFAEFLRNEQFPKELMDLVDSITPLVKIDKWKFKPYKVSEIVELNKENIKKYVCCDKNDYMKKAVKEFLQPSNIIKSIFKPNNILILESYNQKSKYRLVDFGDSKMITKAYKLLHRPFTIFESNHFGTNWFINKIDKFLIVSRYGSDDILLLREI